MDRHPGGTEVTLKLLKAARIGRGSKILDLGAGHGESISLLKERGIQAAGIDLYHPVAPVVKGNMCALGYEGESFDAVLAECSLSVCGDLAAAIYESARVLKMGGKLLVSDVFYKETVLVSSAFPSAVTMEMFEKLVRENGFQIVYYRDISEVLKGYYIESVWQGKNCLPQAEARRLSSRQLGYFMMVCIKQKGTKTKGA